eukprot:1143493-Pelagomonas_calceolata.AAC.3
METHLCMRQVVSHRLRNSTTRGEKTAHEASSLPSSTQANSTTSGPSLPAQIDDTPWKHTTEHREIQRLQAPLPFGTHKKTLPGLRLQMHKCGKANAQMRLQLPVHDGEAAVPCLCVTLCTPPYTSLCTLPVLMGGSGAMPVCDTAYTTVH